MKRLVTAPWFRRRRVGLGWRPVSWQGWIATFALVAAVVVALVFLRGSAARIPIVLLIVGAYALVALSTGGAEAETVEPPASDATRPEQTPTRQTDARPPDRVRPARAVPSGPDVLVVEHLTKRFGERLAVDDLSFSVTAGEVFGFLGPNGAGKTTTVRMLATVMTPSAGSAIVAGIPLTTENGLEIRQQIAVMPENPGLYLRLTVAENLEFFAGLYGLTRAQERIRRALEAVNLGSRENDLCANLSKGLRQRVGLARTLLGDPAIVFLDEPTSGLDPVASREVRQLIDNLRARGITVFLTTHRLDEAQQLCDRVAILNTSLRTIGPPEELRDRLFTKALVVRTAAPLPEPERVFAVAGVESWHADDTSRYSLSVSDARVAAPNVTRALVAAGADVLSLSEAQHSLEDVYLQLVDEDVEAHR
jgi:ABC-2 type transport system ATP-binding protein